MGCFRTKILAGGRAINHIPVLASGTVVGVQSERVIKCLYGLLAATVRGEVAAPVYKHPQVDGQYLLPHHVVLFKPQRAVGQSPASARRAARVNEMRGRS